jgi:hypothetical protein
MKSKLFCLIIIGLMSASLMYAQDVKSDSVMSSFRENEVKPDERLVVLWTSGDPEVARKMVFMYVYNAKKYDWWKEITFIVWGPSSKLLSEDEDLQEKIRKMLKEGIKVEACKACADMYGVSEQLSKLGIEVRYLGEPLTKYKKNGRHVLTF